jgi:uncharacterized protein involved in exopolysaccharide biosynthesis
MGEANVSNEHTVREFLNVLFKRKWTILLIFSSFVVAMLIGNSLTPLAYEANATLVIQRTRGEVLLSPLDSRSFQVQVGAQQDLNSEADLIKSRILLGEVAKDLQSELIQVTSAPIHPDMHYAGLTIAPVTEIASFVKALLQPPNRLTLSPEEQIVAQLSEGIRVSPVPASNVILVRYRHSDPQLAADVVNSLVQAYLDFTVKLRRKADAYRIFESQSEEAQERLRSLTRALSSFDEAAGIMAPQNQGEISFTRLAELENSAKLVRGDLALSRAKMQSIEAQLRATPRRVDTIKEMKWNPVIDDMKSRLARLQVEREQLLGRFTEKHRVVVENANQIRVVTEWLQRESEEVLGAARTDVNPTAQALARELAEVRAITAGLEAKERVLVAEVDSSRQRLARFHEQRSVRDELLREIKVAEDTHFFYKRKTEEARIDSLLDESKITNVKVAEWAQPPIRPTGLRRSLFLVLGSGAAMAAAVGIGFCREFLDSSLGTPEDVERRLDLPVLASISETKDQ